MAKMLIGGELVDAQGGKTIEVRNPANGEVVGQIPRGTPADVDAAVDAARKAFPGWAATPGSKRAKLMHQAALKMHEVVDEVAELLAKEQGKPLAHAKIEAQRATQPAIEAINAAGLPAGVINTVHGSGGEIGDALVSHGRINKIAFTGQTATGKRIMQLAAKNVTRVTLELGGSDAMIVADD